MCLPPAPVRPVVTVPLPCTCPGCHKPAGTRTGTVLAWETHHGHPVVYSLHDLARAAGYRLVPVDAGPGTGV